MLSPHQFRRALAVLYAFLLASTCWAGVAVPVDRNEVDEHRLTPAPYIANGDPHQWIEVKVEIDGSGKVQSAVAVKGLEQFRTRAELLEKKQSFKPFVRDGRSVAVSFVDAVLFAAPEEWISPPVAFPKVKDPASLRIRLERQGTIMRPSYTIELRSTGEVLFDGKFALGLLIAGHHRDRIPRDSVQRLLESFRELNFFSLKDRYQAPELTDTPTYFLSIEMDGRRKEVLDRGNRIWGMPDAVTRLEDAVDQAAGTAKWVAGNSDTVPSLLRERWDFQSNTPDNDWLFWAAIRRPDILRLYLERGLPPYRSKQVNDSPLVSAAMGETPSLLIRLTGKRHKLSARYANTALLMAAAAGKAQNIRFLLAHGADIDTCDPEERGVTALHYAAAAGSVPAVTELLANNPNIRRGDQAGQGLISFLLQNNPSSPDQEQVISVLIRAGADVNAKGGYNGERPLFVLSKTKKCAELVGMLIKAGADVNSRDSDGFTPLMNAGDNAACAEALLAHGADLDAINKYGQTALSLARLGGNSHVATVLETALLKR